MSVQRTRADILPIDHGWAWIIVLAGSGLFGLIAGGFKGQGIILIELIERYPSISPSSLLWVFTVNYVISDAIGPLISYLSIRFGHRFVAIVGVFLFTAGHIGLAYSYNLITIIILHAIPTGLGNGMVILTALLVTAPYFQKRKALALGLVASGSGLFTFILPQILRALFDNMGFVGGMLLYAGFVLHFLCLASLLRPMSFYEALYSSKLKKLEENVTSPTIPPENNALPNGDRTIESELVSNHLEITGTSTSTGTGTGTESFRRNRSQSFNCQNQLENQEKFGFSSTPNISQDKTSASTIKYSNNDRLMVVSTLSGSVYFNEMITDSVTPTDSSPQESTKETFNWRVVYKPTMLMLLASLFLYCMGFSMIYQILPAVAKESGVSKETVAILMAAAGAFEIPCRIGNGFLADKHIMTAYTQYILALVIAGVAVLLCAVISGLAGLIVALIGMSGCGSSVFSLIPVVLTELIGPKNVTSAMGMQVVFQGMGMVATTFITGTLYDKLESWRLVVYYIACCKIAGGAVLLPYWIYQHKLNKPTHMNNSL